MAKTRTLLSPKAFITYCAWMGVGIAMMLAPWLLPLWALAGALGLLVMWRERKTLPAAQDLRLELVLASAPELHKQCALVANLEPTAPLSKGLALSAQLLSPKSRLLRFRILRADFLPQATTSGNFALGARLEAQAERLGFETISEVTLELSSWVGFWKRQITLPLSQPLSFRVSPSLPPPSRERFKALIAQQRILTSGNRQALRSRTRDQFHSLRPYQYPDPIADLDAKKTAKFGKPMIRLFESLHQHRVIIALDVGRSTLGTIAGSPMFDFFVSSILSVARHAIHQKDALSFVAFSQSVHCSIIGAKSMHALAPLLRGDEALLPCEKETDYEVLARFIARHGGGRSIVLLFSDVSRPATQSALLSALRPLCNKHLTVALGVSDAKRTLEHRILDEAEAGLLTPEAYWELFYSYHLDDSFTRFRTAVSGLGGAALQIPHTYWMGTTDKVYELLRSSMRI
jgi:uncharacterized protein (DUF58 family)